MATVDGIEGFLLRAMPAVAIGVTDRPRSVDDVAALFN
jgi:hypothetical protein